MRPTMRPPAGGRAPSREDPVAAAASEVIGGPVGRFADVGRRGWQPVATVLMALSSVFLAGGVLQKAHCLTKGWSGVDQFWHACYSDLPVIYTTSGLSRGVMPYVPHGGQPLDQPLVTGLVMWAVGTLVPSGSTVLAQQQWYFALWAVIVAVLLVLLVLVTTATVSDTPWRAAHVAISPLIVTVGLVSADLLGVLLASAGLWAWTRRRDPLAGVLLGLAVITRSYPVLIVVAIGLVAARNGQLHRWRVLLVGAVAAVAVVTLPWLVIDSGAVVAAYGDWWHSAAGYGSAWLLPQALGHALPNGVVTMLALLGWAVALLVGARLTLSETRRPGVVQVSLVMIAIVLCTGKSVPVQSSLWLLPLIALVGVRWRDHLIWAGAELTYFVAVWLYAPIGQDPNRALPAHVYGIFVLARFAAIAWLARQVWRTAPRAPTFSAGRR